MSIQFGKYRFNREPVDPAELGAFRALLPSYGPVEEGSFFGDGIGILYGGFYTSNRRQRGAQPYHSSSGVLVTWDGRLDNYEELASLLDIRSSEGVPDVEIIAKAYERWGNGCFGRVVGDWALSIWNPQERTLILAKDFVGCRHLYYHLDSNQVAWCTLLDPLIPLLGEVTLDEEYIAGWFSMFPASHLTPYRAIRAVPPSSYVTVWRGAAVSRCYWSFDPGKKIRYKQDSEYEEHFRVVFGQSVKRRLQSDSSVIAELSGGMDSTSIVCMGDHVLARDSSLTPRLETVSYYDDSEPNWNERPYFTKVEEQRGRTGCHIDVGSSVMLQGTSDRFAPTPGSQTPNRVTTQLAAFITSHRSRVLLSGIGGDEVTGGVPTPVPELADLVTSMRLRRLAHQLKAWALAQRRPWMHLMFDVVREFLPMPYLWVSDYLRPPSWLNLGFVRRNRFAVYGYPSRLEFFGPSPSFQENLQALDVLCRHLATFSLPADPHYEKRYPYLDRDLLEFLYAVPREQLIRPGQRRSLMRRALVGIVPDEILNRKRKAYVARSSNTAIVADWTALARRKQQLASETLGILITKEFANAVEKIRQGHDLSIVPLFRTLAIETWLSQFSEERSFRLTDGHAPEALAYTRSSLSG
jgi:asparagine synthase (glutamine-hydrolysing)